MEKLKPFSFIFNEAWAIYKNHFGTLVGIASVPSIIFFLSSFFFVAGLNIIISILLSILVFLVGLVFSFASGLALIYAIKDKADFKTSYKNAFAGFWAYGWIVFLIMIITMGGIFMGLIPGIIFSIFFVFSAYVFVFEGDKGLSALMKSREYVRNYWWAVWWKLFLIGIAAVPLILVYLAIIYILYAQQIPYGKDIADIIKQLGTILITPFAIAYALSVYRNLVQIKPELLGKKIETKRGFWIFAAIWGVVAPMVLIPIFAFSAIYLLNPAGLLQQARDSQRIADLSTLESALAFYQEPFCENTSVHLSNEGTRAVDGTGWLPIDFTKIEGGSPIDTLPIDPTNRDKYFYAYMCNPDTQNYEINAVFESERFDALSGGDKGNNDNVYEVGTDLYILR